jgi:hypothetical protein
MDGLDRHIGEEALFLAGRTWTVSPDLHRPPPPMAGATTPRRNHRRGHPGWSQPCIGRLHGRKPSRFPSSVRPSRLRPARPGMSRSFPCASSPFGDGTPGNGIQGDRPVCPPGTDVRRNGAVPAPASGLPLRSIHILPSSWPRNLRLPSFFAPSSILSIRTDTGCRSVHDMKPIFADTRKQRFPVVYGDRKVSCQIAAKLIHFTQATRASEQRNDRHISRDSVSMADVSS